MGLGNKYRLTILLSGCAGAGGVVLAVSTPWGLGLSPDSAVYVGAARSLIEGEGFSLPTDSGALAPIAHYPPLYPVLLAGPGFVGLSPIAVARWLNVLLFSFNVFLAGTLTFSSTASLRLAAITSVLVATAFPMVLVHSMAWSEPLFMFFELCGMLLLLAYLWQADSRRLSGAAVITGLTILSRYAGLALVMSGALAILLIGRSRWKKRIVDATFFLAISLLPMGLWVIRNYWVAGSATHRKIGFHPAGFDRLGDFVSTLVSWFSGFGSASIRIQILTVCFVLLGGSLLLCEARFLAPQDVDVKAPRGLDALQLMALIIGNYLLLLYLSISVLDAQIPLDSRILSPLYVPFVLIAVALCHRMARRSWTVRGGCRFILPTVALLVLGLQLPGTLNWLRELYRDGIGYSSRVWMQSDLVKQLRLVDRYVSIYSNAPDVVYTLVGRPAGMIPRKADADSNQPNPDYDSQIAAMKNRLKAKSGLLVYFNRVRWRWYLPPPSELEQALGLDLLIRTNDGSIYKVN